MFVRVDFLRRVHHLNCYFMYQIKLNKNSLFIFKVYGMKNTS